MIQKGMIKRGDRVAWLPSIHYGETILIGTVTEVKEEIEPGSYPGRLVESIMVAWNIDHQSTSSTLVMEPAYHKVAKICTKTL